jgi:hypothetical protein
MIHRGLCAVARIDREQGLLTLPAGIGLAGSGGPVWLRLA